MPLFEEEIFLPDYDEDDDACDDDNADYDADDIHEDDDDNDDW